MIIKGKAVNLGDGEGMQVPCKLKCFGQEQYVKILQKELTKKNRSVTIVVTYAYNIFKSMIIYTPIQLKIQVFGCQNAMF